MGLCLGMITWAIMLIIILILKNRSGDDSNFVIIGGYRGYHYGKFCCHQWWESEYNDNLFFVALGEFKVILINAILRWGSLSCTGLILGLCPASERWHYFVTTSRISPDVSTHLVWPGGCFKNTYELLNLRAVLFSSVDKIHIFQYMGKIFCVEFQKMWFLNNFEILRASRFKSSYMSLKCPPGTHFSKGLWAPNWYLKKNVVTLIFFCNNPIRSKFSTLPWYEQNCELIGLLLCI